MKEDKLFKTSGARPFLLRYGLFVAAAMLTLLGTDIKQMMLIMGVGLVVVGVIQWLLAHFENEDYLSTMWTANRSNVQANKKAKTEKARQKQLEARRKEAIDRAKREGKTVAFVAAGMGIAAIIYGLV